jgi:hypothetical protein
MLRETRAAPTFLASKAECLLVQGADPRAFLVVQHGQVDGAGQVVLGEFRRGAGVDDCVEGGQFIHADGSFPSPGRWGGIGAESWPRPVTHPS